ncbi:MAG: putative nucleotidyltransferase substrate binding domain-containing protein [Actinomycetota bacterium]
MSLDTELLRTHVPFAELDDADLAALVAASELVSLRDAQLVLEEGGAPSEALYVVRTGSIELDRDGEVFDVLGPGESFGFPSLLSGSRPVFDVRAKGITSCLKIPRGAAERILGSGPGLRYLATGLRERAALVERTLVTDAERAIETAGSREELIGAIREVRATAIALREGGYEAGPIARAIAGLLDAGTRRALSLAILAHGVPDVAWAWVVFGSIARREPGLAPDQDHTILWEGDGSLDPAFSAIAEFVTETLSRAGVPPCESGILATTPTWRGPVDSWADALVTRRGARAKVAFRLAFALDARKVAGDLRTESLLARLTDEVLGSDLLWRLARLAVEARPPVGALGGLVTERAADGRRVLDLKLGGLLPVTDIARVEAIRGHHSSTETHQRLRDSAAVGVIDHGEAQALLEAFDTFLELRLDRQVACVRRGLPVDSLEEPAALDPVSRTRLRASYRVVDHVQERLRREFGGGRFG